MKNIHGVDLDLVIANATSDGIDLSEIVLFYSDLTDTQENELILKKLFVSKSAARIIAKFNAEGIALFPNNITEVYCLSA